MWQCSNIFDIPLMHTCLFNRSSAIEKKRMIFNELLKMSIVDDNNVPIFSYIIDSFHDKSTNTKESIIKYVKEHITLENNDRIDQDITISISKLVSYTILKWIDTDTFMKEI